VALLALADTFHLHLLTLVYLKTFSFHTFLGVTQLPHASQFAVHDNLYFLLPPVSLAIYTYIYTLLIFCIIQLQQQHFLPLIHIGSYEPGFSCYLRTDLQNICKSYTTYFNIYLRFSFVGYVTPRDQFCLPFFGRACVDISVEYHLFLTSVRYTSSFVNSFMYMYIYIFSWILHPLTFCIISLTHRLAPLLQTTVALQRQPACINVVFSNIYHATNMAPMSKAPPSTARPLTLWRLKYV